MKRAIILKQLIQDKGLNIKEFATLAGIPYTTLVNILNRGVSKAGFSNIIKICEALEITVEQLEQIANKNNETENYKIHTIAAQHDADEWTEDELQSIEEFKQFVVSKRKNK